MTGEIIVQEPTGTPTPTPTPTVSLPTSTPTPPLPSATASPIAPGTVPTLSPSMLALFAAALGPAALLLIRRRRPPEPALLSARLSRNIGRLASTVRELSADREVLAAFPLMRQLRDRIREDTFLAEVRRQQVEGYRLIGLFDEERLVALAGVRRTHTLSRGEHLFVDDLVSAEGERGRGYGRELMRWLARRAKSEGLDRIDLDSRATAKGFYEKLGFRFHTSIPCWIGVDELLGGG